MPDRPSADATVGAARKNLRPSVSFPVTLELSDAETTQARISLENALDYDDTAQDDLKTAIEHLREQE
jgi:hypothetical protein